jgi:aromatic-L-amino-acid/L-tryptophan decarboxylase
MIEKPRPLALSGDEFRRLGHALVEQIATFYDGLPGRAVTRDTAPDEIREMLGRQGLPADGRPAAQLLEDTARLLFEHSLHNGHPRFMGYITSSAAPLGALGDLLAASVNSNVGLWDLAPVASEIEGQTIRWLAELIGYPRECGGLMVSGGNMANLIGFFAARRARTPWNIREQGLYGDAAA